MNLTLQVNQQVTFKDRNTTIGGIIKKMNPKRCVVQLTQGNHRFLVGMEITVPYSALGATDYGVIYDPQKANKPETFVKPEFKPDMFWVGEHTLILVHLSGLFNELSPENLCCDGEATRSQIMTKKAKLDKEFTHCWAILGVQLTETEHANIMAEFHDTITQTMKSEYEHLIRFKPAPPVYVKPLSHGAAIEKYDAHQDALNHQQYGYKP